MSSNPIKDIKPSENTTNYDKDDSFANAQVKKRKTSFINQPGVKPELISSNLDKSLEGSDSTTDSKNKKNTPRKEKENFNEIVLSQEDISKDLGDESLMNSSQSKTYVTLSRLLYSSSCMKFYVGMIIVSILVLLYSIFAYFVQVSNN